jgi:hypothetical protein
MGNCCGNRKEYKLSFTNEEKLNLKALFRTLADKYP